MRVYVSSPYQIVNVGLKHTFYEIDSERMFQYVFHVKRENFDNFYGALQDSYAAYVTECQDRNLRAVSLYWRLQRGGKQYFEMWHTSVPICRWWGNFDFAWHYVENYGYATYLLEHETWTRYRTVSTFDDVFRLAVRLVENPI